MPGLKPKEDGNPAQPRKPRQVRRQGFVRARMTPTHGVEHVVEQCPGCGAQLSGGWIQRTREVIDLPRVPARVHRTRLRGPYLSHVLQPSETGINLESSRPRQAATGWLAGGLPPESPAQLKLKRDCPEFPGPPQHGMEPIVIPTWCLGERCPPRDLALYDIGSGHPYLVDLRLFIDG